MGRCKKIVMQSWDANFIRDLRDTTARSVITMTTLALKKRTLANGHFVSRTKVVTLGLMTYGDLGG